MGHLDRSDLFHALLACFLLFEQLAFAAGVAAIAFGCHVLAQGTHSFEEALADRSRWGRLVESAVGAHLLATADQDTQIHYWRDAAHEVDFVVEHRGRLAAIEVKSQGLYTRPRGLDAFCAIHNEAKRWVVGSDALPLGEFFAQSAAHWVM